MALDSGVSPEMPGKNPLLARMIGPIEGQSGRARWIVKAVGMSAFGLAMASVAVAQISQIDSFGYASLIIAALSLLVVAVLPWIGLIMTTLLTARLTSDEDFALVRISTLSEMDIYRGILDGNLSHVGGIRTMGLWLIAASLPGVALIIAAALLSTSCNQGGCRTDLILYALYGALPASLVLGGVALVYWFMWKSSINSGIWVAVRAARSAVTVASAVITIGITASLVVFLGEMVILFGSYFDNFPVARLTSLSLILVVPVSYGAARLARLDTLRALAKPNSMPTPAR